MSLRTDQDRQPEGVGDQDVPQALQGRLLGLQGFGQGLGRDAALLGEHVADAVFQPLLVGVRVDHHPVLEGDGDLLLVVLEGEDAGLPLQPDELEDVGKAEVLDRSFEGHSLIPSGS